METLNDQNINRKNYRVALKRSTEFDGVGKMIATGNFYLYIQGTKGKISLGVNAIKPLAKALLEIEAGKIKLTNDKPCIVNNEFIIKGYKRFKFNEEGIRVREGSVYIVIENPSTRKLIIDGSLIGALAKDLQKLKPE